MNIRPLTNEQNNILNEFKAYFQERLNDISNNTNPDDIESSIGEVSAYNEFIELIDSFLNAKVSFCDECPHAETCVDRNTRVSEHYRLRH